MKDMQAHLEKLRNEAEECDLISKLATNATKKALFAKLAEHYRALVKEVEQAIAASSVDRSG
ncbi:hypothetical protein AAFX91_12760 [Bradyrhizobium sp. 31Argb]|uniref:hypothetical protein n=1 Tax=unclassified Bradyrhizobium TaxID=2631580 RepID=UPI00102EA566|nr:MULTISPECIES: hypothetical protein [unclassified Bradyrhizobium]MDI4237269.1 hypothetical protein [Bradyrhizobium sp. Arg237L]TAI61246.1 hypothetical protein CWO89_36150 [Bradyrhizobium sp. Leo170]